MIRVLIADDQALVRAGLSALLEAEPDLEVVGAAADGVEALAMAWELTPDIACLDIRMPGMDGIEVTRRLCGPGVEPPIPVLVLTTFDLDDYVFGALEAGASGFLLKDADPATIVRAVHQVAAGQGTIDQALTRRVLREFVLRRSLQPVTAGRAGELLTPRERDIVLLLAQGMSNEEIAAALFVEVSTVKSHLARLLPKLGVRSRLQAAVWAYQSGLAAVPERQKDPSRSFPRICRISPEAFVVRVKSGPNGPTKPEEIAMTQYLMSVFGPAEPSQFNGYPSKEAMEESFAETGAFNERLQQQGYWVFADGLGAVATATVVDGQGSEPVLTDGPYLESKEHLAGFWIIEAPDLDVALRLAAEGSKACRGKVEVRPFGDG